MKRKLLTTLLTVFAALGLQAQVTQINSNRSLSFDYPLSNTKHIFASSTDNSVWVTDGSLAGTIQLSDTIQFEGSLGSLVFFDGKLIFSGTGPSIGTELFVTDGTPAGTMAIADINPGAPGSSPDNDNAVLNGFIYFTAERPFDGRELWRTNGTPAGTTLVKDIFPGPTGSNNPGEYDLFSSGTYLLFAARTESSGIELWRSNGTDAGTAVLLDINTGNGGADSSNPRSFFLLNSTVLFAATNATDGEEVWRTDGTPGGTAMLADINPTGSSTTIELFGFPFDILRSFHVFNGRAYFTAFDGTSTGQVYSTNGTVGNADLLKDIVPGGGISIIAVADAINLPNKFIFPVGDQDGRSQLWQSDGTPDGTTVFQTFAAVSQSDFPFILLPFSFTGGTLTQSLFQGNKFFFMASKPTEGRELWVSDGVDSTAAHTHIVSDINPGEGDGVIPGSYIYTSAALFFPADNGTNGLELWKTDGTTTSMVADIVLGATGSEPNIDFFLVNSKIVFEADNGDNANETDLYAVDGTFSPLPLKLRDFTVIAKSADAILNWHTSQELNSKDFTVQRSFDGLGFNNIGSVAASGTSSNVHAYSFMDLGVVNSGKGIVYYRLSIADKDGKSVLSPVITLKLKNTGKWDVRLLSNPVSENIKLVFSGITQNVQVSIIDMGGNKLYTSSLAALNGQISIPAASLPHGRYVLLTETGKERKAIQFVK